MQEKNHIGPTVGELLLSSYVGDRVRHVDDGMFGNVLSVRENTLCVRWDDGKKDYHTLTQLVGK